MLDEKQKVFLLTLARDTIESILLKKSLNFDIPKDEIFQTKKGAFVTLTKHGQLRGCIGYIHGYKSILETIIEMARSAAFRDPRFSPVKAEELGEIEIEISILSELVVMEDASEIEIGRDGLFIENPHGSGLLLPQVATEYNWDTMTFLQETCRKAGLNRESWKSEESTVYRFSAEIFSEKQKNN